MSSYRGVWDVGPPGAEAEYAGQRAQQGAPPAPTTDPWTGASYANYPTAYDYSAYPYPYPYDSAYYNQQRAGTYYGNYPPQQGYEYTQRPREQSRSPTQSRSYGGRPSYRSNSRSPSGSDRRKKTYARRRDSSYERNRQRRSRSMSSRKNNYSSSDRTSSRSRSYPRTSPNREKKHRRSASTASSNSNRSYRKQPKNRRDRDLSTSPVIKTEKSFRSQRRARSSRTPSFTRSVSRSPKPVKVKIEKSENNKEVDKERKTKDTVQARKRKDSDTPKNFHRKNDKASLSPPIKYKKSEYSSTPTKLKRREHNSGTPPPRKMRDSSLTPPKSYARGESMSSSKSRSRSSTPKRKNIRRSRSRYSSRSPSSASSRRSRSKSARNSRKSMSRHRSRSKSRLKRRSDSENRSTPRRRSRSRGKAKNSLSPKASKSRSPSSRSRSRSQSGSTSEDDRRGQFTVADRKRFWKIHRSKQSERDKEPRSPPKELKPPPGVIDSTSTDDIEYKDPPEVEGPNFAELLPSREQLLKQASTSKKAVPIQIKNDGSFLEMFKKMQEDTKNTEVLDKKPAIKKPVLPFIGKRRGGRVLKTGMVKKAKAIDEQLADNMPKDAWSLYMQEVKKYRETSCEEERKTRPLVK